MSPKATRTERPAAPPPAALLSFTAPGLPIGQAAVTGGGTHTDANGRVTRKRAYYQNGKDLKPWRNTVAAAAEAAARTTPGWPVHRDVPIQLGVTFYLDRKPSVRRTYPTVRPDLQHLVRAIEDALGDAGIWGDDAQVTDSGQRKRYVDDDHPTPCAVIAVRPLPPEQP